METISQVRQQGAYLVLYRPLCGCLFQPLAEVSLLCPRHAGQVRIEMRTFSQKKFVKSGNFFRFFLIFMYVIQHCLLHLPPLRFHCVGGCWDRTQDCCNFGIDSQTR
jgi:hypothetical protein